VSPRSVVVATSTQRSQSGAPSGQRGLGRTLTLKPTFGIYENFLPHSGAVQVLPGLSLLLARSILLRVADTRMAWLDCRQFPTASYFIDNGRHRMNLPDAPIAHEGFFATHFFTVRDLEKSKDIYVRILAR
jgi:hypothetical protein